MSDVQAVGGITEVFAEKIKSDNRKASLLTKKCIFIHLFGSTIQSAREIQINRRKNPPVGGKAAQIFLNLNFKLQLQLHHRTGTQTHPAPERSHDPNKHIHDM